MGHRRWMGHMDDGSGFVTIHALAVTIILVHLFCYKREQVKCLQYRSQRKFSFCSVSSRMQSVPARLTTVMWPVSTGHMKNLKTKIMFPCMEIGENRTPNFAWMRSNILSGRSNSLSFSKTYKLCDFFPGSSLPCKCTRMVIFLALTPSPNQRAVC